MYLAVRIVKKQKHDQVKSLFCAQIWYDFILTHLYSFCKSNSVLTLKVK